MMNTPIPPPKTRSDCVIDSTLDGEAADALAQRLDHGLSNRAAVSVLREEHGITLSESAVARWAAKRRKARSARTFAALCETIERDQKEARALGGASGDVDALYQANVLLITQALFAAQRNGDAAGVAQAAKVFSGVLGAVTRARRAADADRAAAFRAAARADAEALKACAAEKRCETEMMAAETERMKVEFDPERAALDHIEELKKINGDKNLTRHEKMMRAADVIFGRNVAPPNPAAGEAKEASDKGAHKGMAPIPEPRLKVDPGGRR